MPPKRQTVTTVPRKVATTSFLENLDVFLQDRIDRSKLQFTPPPDFKVPAVPGASADPAPQSQQGQQLSDDEVKAQIGWRSRLHRRNNERSLADIRTRFTWTPNIVGNKVSNFKDLVSPRDYLLWPASRLGDLQMTLQRSALEKAAPPLMMDQARYVLTLHHDPRRLPIYLAQFMYALITILEFVYDGTLAEYDGRGQYEVHFEVTHPDMTDVNSGIITSIVPLTVSNRDHIIEDILDQLMST